jgi:hypothetical protein
MRNRIHFHAGAKCTCNRVWLWGAVAIVLSLGQAVYAQGPGGAEPDDKPITVSIQKEVIDSVGVALNEIYVFPDVAKKMEKHLRDQYKKNAYKEITSTRDFAQKLTEDMQEISKDRHLHLDYFSDEDIAGFVNDTLTDDERARNLQAQQRGNFGFRQIEMLPGNVGYLRFDGFSDAGQAGATAIAAMNFLAYADAIIFDLRQNGGGSPSMIQLISSYLFEEPVHLNSFYIRKEDTVNQFWTQSYVQGPRMTSADAYVLTSARTFSAAEEFTYNLKNLKRATIVGETTGGGAHPVDGRFFPNFNLAMSLPFGRAVNPITGTNWEGTGVAPDIGAPETEAKDVAYQDALKKILARTKDEERKAQLEWAIEALESKLHPPDIDVASLARYAGDYGPRTIIFEDGALYDQREDRPKYRMIPMAKDLFRFDEIDYFRLKVETDDNGNPTELIGLYDNGRTDRSPKGSQK